VYNVLSKSLLIMFVFLLSFSNNCFGIDFIDNNLLGYQLRNCLVNPIDFDGFNFYKK
jgi:hypothetical protein